MVSLNLTYPGVQQGQRLLVETQPGALQSWSDNLPFGQMDKALSAFLEKVQRLNRTELSWRERAPLMEVLNPPYRMIQSYYFDVYLLESQSGSNTQSLPLSLKTLTKEMAFGYKKLCAESIQKNVILRLSYKRLQAQQFNWAIHYLGLTLLNHYVTYEQVPNAIWRELYQIYYYAHVKSFDDLDIPLNNGEALLSNIELSFKRILLIAVTSPYHFEPGDLWDVYHYLKHYTFLSALAFDQKPVQDKQHFCADLNSDKPPTYVSREYVFENTQKMVTLQTTDLLVKLQMHLQTLEQHQQLPQPGFRDTITVKRAKRLLTELSKRWDKHIVRQYQRQPSQKLIELVWGLENIYHLFMQYDTLSQTDSIEQLPSIGETPQNEEKTVQENADISRWETINASAKGLCVHRFKPETQGLEVGQLVTFRPVKHESNTMLWTMCIVRWLKQVPGQGTTLGLEILPGRPQPVTVTPFFKHAKAQNSHRALLISGEKIQGKYTPTLISSTKLHYKGRQITIEVGSESFQIIAQKKATETSHFTRFFYKTVDETIHNPNEIEDNSF
ncbi:MAG: hypothetical protein AAGB12_04035 [Pseudomonadota bacterium]